MEKKEKLYLEFLIKKYSKKQNLYLSNYSLLEKAFMINKTIND